MTETARKVWSGHAWLEPFLVPVDELVPHPNNPRRGDRERMYDALVRFGQMKPVLVDEQGTIVAGHTLHAVAVERLGWSHVAAVRLEGVDDVTAFEYLVSDNAVSDTANYDAREAKIAAEGVRGMVDELRSRLEEETEAASRDQLANQLEGLERAASMLEEFGVVRQAGGDVDAHAIDKEWCCPDCSYQWRGEG